MKKQIENKYLSNKVRENSFLKMIRSGKSERNVLRAKDFVVDKGKI